MLGRLKNLRMLNRGHNQLTSIPAKLGDITELTDFLYLHDNRLTALPSFLGQLKRLRYLNIAENALHQLPECGIEIAGLIELRLIGNQLSAIPDALARHQAHIPAGIDRSTCPNRLATFPGLKS